MEMDLLHAIKHTSIYIKKFVGDETILLTIDGLASRNGVFWIDECKLNNVEIFIAPADTYIFSNYVTRLLTATSIRLLGV